MKRNLLVLLLALMTSMPMLAQVANNETKTPGANIHKFPGDPVTSDVAINETNFPDANFRKYVQDSIMGSASATILTAAKRNETTKIWIPDVQITTLKGIEYFPRLCEFACSGVQTAEIPESMWNLTNMYLQGDFTSFDITNIAHCAFLSIDAPLTSLTYTGPDPDYIFRNSSGACLKLKNTKLTTIDLSIFSSVIDLGIYDTDVPSCDLILPPSYNGMEAVTLNNTTITNLDLSGQTWRFHELTLQNNSNLCSLTLPSDKSRLTDIEINGNPLLTSLNVDDCSALKHLGYTGNGFKSVDVSHNTALEVLKCNDNELTSLDVSNNTALKFLYCQNNLLTSLDLSNNTNLRGLDCSNNQLTELELSNNPELKTEFVEESDLYKSWCNRIGNYIREHYNDEWYQEQFKDMSEMLDVWEFNPSISLSPQNIDKDYVAIDGRSKLGVQCNTNDGVLTSYGTYSAVTSTDDNNNYIVVGDGTSDVHAYRDTVRYSYNTGYTGDYDEAKTMAVKIGTSAHGMYVHPETKTTEYDNSYNGFYWGTLYLEFPARIPGDVQCYYAKSLDVNEDLANLTEVTGTIPANTAVIVKAPTEPKFFAFNESDETPDAPTDNIMAGTIEVLPVAKRSVLTLGFNVSNKDGEEGQFGFWDYVGTRINPFRAYVPKSNVPAGAKGGFSLIFPGDDTNGIARLTNDSAVQDGTWFTLSGVRLNGKPTAKGIYVNGGKKVVIK